MRACALTVALRHGQPSHRYVGPTLGRLYTGQTEFPPPSTVSLCTEAERDVIGWCRSARGGGAGLGGASFGGGRIAFRLGYMSVDALTSVESTAHFNRSKRENGRVGDSGNKTTHTCSSSTLMCGSCPEGSDGLSVKRSRLTRRSPGALH